MHVQQWVAVAFLSAFIVAPAAAFEIKPGEWELEVKIQADSQEMALPKSRDCVTPEEAKFEYIKEKEMGCDVKIIERRSDFTSYEVVCDEQRQRGTIKGTMKKISDNEVVLNSTITAFVEGQKKTSQVTVRQKFISSTCSKETLLKKNSMD